MACVDNKRKNNLYLDSVQIRTTKNFGNHSMRLSGTLAQNTFAKASRCSGCGEITVEFGNVVMAFSEPAFVGFTLALTSIDVAAQVRNFSKSGCKPIQIKVQPLKMFIALDVTEHSELIEVCTTANKTMQRVLGIGTSTLN